MNEDRFSALLHNRIENVDRADRQNLCGFTNNPLADKVTPMQAQMYQAAYRQAQKAVQEPEWPGAECWN